MAHDQLRLEHLYLTGVKPNGKHIGKGAYGRVFEVEFCGNVCAAKQIHSTLIEDVTRQEFEHMKALFIGECLRSSALGHQNVVQVLGVYNPDGDASPLPVLVMEMMQQSLKSLVEKHPNIPMYVKLSILLDVSQGLWYLHSHNPPIIHRDLTPNNILLTDQYMAKISDLGVAKAIRVEATTRAPGTLDFMSPEALQETPEGYGLPLDVFSYGGVILHVVNQEWPDPQHFVAHDSVTGTKVALSEIKRRQKHIDKMVGTPDDLQAMVKQCLEDQPDMRPLISDVAERMKRMKAEESTNHPNTEIVGLMNQSEQTAELKEDADKPPPLIQVRLQGFIVTHVATFLST